MALLVLLNNFLHDFSAAGWIFGTVLAWTLLRRSRAEASDPLKTFMRPILRLMGASLAGIILFGFFRALAYRRYEWSVLAGHGQVTLLLIKHVVLAALVAVGLVIVSKARKSLRGG